MINAMMIQLYMPLNLMGMLYREIKQAAIDIETMFGILARPAEIKDAPDAKPLDVTAGAIRFEDVCFAYAGPADPAGVELRGAGRPYGGDRRAVGRGKVDDLAPPVPLLRRDRRAHRHRWSGHPRRDEKVVAQQHRHGSAGHRAVNNPVRYNIRYGRWDATDEQVEEAARLAQIDAFIRVTPRGYETEVGERGLKLSGGEKQRVAIGRTILKAPPILLLDEATSALDSHTEKDIQDALERVSQNRTTLVIAHRLSTIVGADEIIVLDQGRIVERGTHPALLVQGGLTPAC